ncbi:MAG TPA: glutaredoxin domain-containing protein [Gemmatimonadaceae bacterium]|nr:glutaredoxin domain-containing protein [Gemmatimonadaceae bacterium]
MTDKLRATVAGVLANERGDRYLPVKVLREVLGTANDLVGRPFCTQAELDERRAGGEGNGATARREPAPVMLYFDGKDHRTKKKIEELLVSKEIPFKVLDVTDDEATRSWATTAAKQVEFPLLFIAGEPVGGLHELTQLDVNGQLARRVFGAD